MFGRIVKKSDRLAIQESQFGRLVEQGYVQEVYKGLNIFTRKEFHERDKKDRWYLKIYRDTATNPTHNFYYSREDRFIEAISDAKKSYDIVAVRKAEEKNKPGFKTGAAACAAAIRAELKIAFPGVKFSVTSDTYSMGNSVRIFWSDGPTDEQVTAITGKYQYGHFDGMNDMYENSNSRDDIPQAKFVHEERRMTPETRALLEPIAHEMFGEKDGYNRDHLYLIYRKSSIPAGAKITGIGRTDKDCGLFEDIYKITFEGGTPYPDYKPKQMVEASETTALKDEIQKTVEFLAETDIAIYDQVTESVKEIARIQNVSIDHVVNVGALIADFGAVQLVRYSDRAVALFGETKPIKDILNDAKGKFNNYLKHNGETKPGWIFPYSRLEEVKQLMS